MLTNQVRRVLAKYIEDPDEGSSYNTREKSWMEYEKSKNKTTPEGKRDCPILKGVNPKGKPTDIPEADEFGDENVTYNPYDYKDPSTKPKQLGDSQPFENKFPPHARLFYVTRPSLFKEEGPFYEWAKSRREDWTADPAQQNPAMSLDARYAADNKSVQNVITLFFLKEIPTQSSLQVKTAASLLEIDSMFRGGDSEMYGKTYQKSQNIPAVTWTNQNNQDQVTRGLYQFTVPSSSGAGDYNAYLQFLRTKNKKDTPRGYLDFDVEMSCSCNSFLYFGAQYYAVQGKYMYMPGFRPSLLPPHPRTQTVSITKSTKEQLTGEESGRGRANKGKGLNFRMCKHLMKVMDFVRDNLRVDESAARKNYPLVGRPSFIVNKDKWEEAFKFPFTKEEIQKQLTSGLNKVPNFYKTVYTREKRHYDQVDEWVRSVFNDLPSAQKIAYLRFLVEHPEEIFYVLWRHAVDIYPDKIDPILVNTGFRLMDKTIKSESDQEPEESVEQKGKDVYKGPNMTGPLQDLPSMTEEEPVAPGKTPTEMGKPGLEKDEDKEEPKAEEPEKEKPKKVQPLKGKKIPKDIREKRQKSRGVRKTDIRNEI